MRSKRSLQTVKLEVAYSLIQDNMAQMLMAFAKGKISSTDDIVAIKLNYPGGHVAQDKVIPIEIILKKEADLLQY